jgi:ethanolamine utilization protein EutL
VIDKTMTRIALRPSLLACRQIDAVDEAFAVALGIDNKRHQSIGLVSCDQDDALYIALDEATKNAAVDVVFGNSFYAGSKHPSGPYSGEVLGIVGAESPDDVAEALWLIKQHLQERVCFETFAGEPFASKGGPAFLAHVVRETGSYLSASAGVAPGSAIAYLIAPPVEAHVAVDAALKSSFVKLLKWFPPPSPTNYAGCYLSGEVAALEAAAGAFAAAVHDVALRPLAAASRPMRLRR